MDEEFINSKELDQRYKDLLRENTAMQEENQHLRKSIDTDMKSLINAYSDLKFKCNELERDNKQLVLALHKKEEDYLHRDVTKTGILVKFRPKISN
jgi:regulator of replication initiation timing